MIVNAASISSDWFLNGITSLQNQITKTSVELSSGYQVNSAADAPSQVPALVNLGSTLASLQTYQQNLTSVQNEAQTADSALSSAVTLVQSAQSIAVQATGVNLSASNLETMATQVQNIQQQLVSIANTTVGDKYIFGGDESTSPPYQYDATSTSGADQLTAQSSTFTFVNPSGETVYRPLTALQIFDNRDANGNPTASNVFTALQSLSTALQNDDVTGVTTALSSLQTASDWLNQEQASYGSAEQTITSEQNTTSNQITSVQESIGSIRDTNEVQAATDLSQETAAEQAAFEAQAAVPNKSLFDYLG